MIKSEIVIDQHYKDFSPMQFGSETCDPGHFFGPSVRTHWLLHYVVYGFGRFERKSRGAIFGLALQQINQFLSNF